MKIVFISFCVIIQLYTYAQGGAQIQFDFTEIIDTITVDDLDTSCMCVKGPEKYTFQFTNVGKEPLIVGFTAGSDPDFNCYYPKAPVQPGKRDSISICVPPGRFALDKFYTINDNSALKQTVHVKRVKALDDSVFTYMLKRQKKQQTNVSETADTSGRLVIVIANLPDSLRKEFREYNSQSFFLDTALEFMEIDISGTKRSYRLVAKNGAEPVNALIVIRNGKKSVQHYDYDGNLLMTRELIRTKKLIFQDKETSGIMYRETYSLKYYQNGKVTRKKKLRQKRLYSRFY